MHTLRCCQMLALALWLSVVLCGGSVLAAQDDKFYKLLDIDRSATTKDIRKAFKKVALKMHPDKNTDDPDADEKFIRINRAYEVLKDEDLRKTYDQFGEEGLEDKQTGQGYHSWSYYRDNFGIYDEDPEVITLSTTDFESSVSGSSTVWFINFYHPMCSHCHLLAPDWRWLAAELAGVVRVGAVNCDDEFALCAEQGVSSYPALLAYPGLDQYRLSKSRDQMLSFILSRLPTGLGVPLTAGVLHNLRRSSRGQEGQEEGLLSGEGQEQGLLSGEEKDESGADAPPEKPWLVVVLRSSEDLAEQRVTLIKLAAIFSGLVSVGRVNCEVDAAVCKTLGVAAPDSAPTPASVFRYYGDGLGRRGVVKGVWVGSEEEEGVAGAAQKIAQEVLALMPRAPLLEEEEYLAWAAALEGRVGARGRRAWLVHFMSEADDDELELRKVGGLTAPLVTRRALCSAVGGACDALHITKTPAFVLFKPGGGYEMHQGRLLAQDVANFAREAAAATHFTTLTPKEFPAVLAGGGGEAGEDALWFVDFYAPWCPPCRRLLPVFRKASVLMRERLQQQQQQQGGGGARAVNFGIIDCTAHGPLCSQFNIDAYPTTVLYNRSMAAPHRYRGPHHAAAIVDFVVDTLNPTVISLDPASFSARVQGRAGEQVWVVDFFAAWCGPCQAMAPEYRKFGRLVASLNNVFVASVDCADHRSLCSSEGVHSYPTIRIYHPAAGPRAGHLSEFNSREPRDASSFRRWLYEQLPSASRRLDERSFEEVLRGAEPWLVYFYSPWCGPCMQFSPEFEDVARSLEASGVRCGKVDCQALSWVCHSAGVRAYPSVAFYPGLEAGEGGDGWGRGEQRNSGWGSRQSPEGEVMESLDPEFIISQVQWRLQQSRRIRGQQNQIKDEL